MNKAFLCTAILCLFIGPVSASELDLNYDFRFRYEYTDDGSKADTRNRNRIRTRLGAKYSPSEKLHLFIRFATAEERTPHPEIKHWERISQHLISVWTNCI